MPDSNMLGVRSNQAASNSLTGRPKYGKVDYQWTPYQRPTWTAPTTEVIDETIIEDKDDTVIDETVVVDNNNSNVNIPTYTPATINNTDSTYDTGFGGSSGGWGFGGSGGVGNTTANAPSTLFNVPVIGQTADRVETQIEEHGFTTDDVLAAAAELEAGNTLEGFEHQGQFQGGADQVTQHADLDALNAEYAEALRAIPNDGSATAEQRIAAAAANPAYNAEAAAAHSDVAVGVGNIGPNGWIGQTKRADNVLSSDAYNVIEQDIARGASDEDRNSHQYGLAGTTAAAAGIRNIGGANAQSGDNQGLPMDYLVVGDSGGGEEVWGPDGKTYASVEEAQAAVDGVSNLLQDQTGTFHDPNFVADSVTGARGQFEGQQAAATKQANAYVEEQAEFEATATAEEIAANEQDQLLGDFLWKYEGADNSQMQANYAAQAEAAGLDFGGLSASDFVTSDAVAGKDKDKLKADAKAALTAKKQGINTQHQAARAATGADDDESAEDQAAYETSIQIADDQKFKDSISEVGLERAIELANQSGSSADIEGVQRQLLQEVMAVGGSSEQAAAPAAAPTQSPAVQEILVANHGYIRQPDGSIRSPHYDILGYNMGGYVGLPMYRADGGEINIKPSRRGLFTRKAENAGMSVPQYTRQVLSAPKGKYPEATRKQAQFASNASKWSK